jgi:hypothetical protein
MAILATKTDSAGTRRIPPFSVLLRSALWRVCGESEPGLTALSGNPALDTNPKSFEANRPRQLGSDACHNPEILGADGRQLIRLLIGVFWCSLHLEEINSYAASQREKGC